MTALHACFGYRDAPAAIDWLTRTFGFETILCHPDDDGGIAYAELLLGDAAIVVFSDRDGYERPPRKGDTVGFGTYGPGRPGRPPGSAAPTAHSGGTRRIRSAVCAMYRTCVRSAGAGMPASWTSAGCVSRTVARLRPTPDTETRRVA